jgi:uncharacterized repeat protein (TIGR01451 family)
VLVNATDAWGVIIFHPAVQVRKNVNVPEAQPGSVLEYSVSVFNPSEARAYNVSVYEFSQPGFYNTSGTAAVYELRTSGIKEWLTYLGAISIRNASVNKTGTNVSALYFDLSNISSVTGSAIRNGSLASYAGLTIKFNMTAGANAVTGSDEAWAQGNYYDGTFASMDYDTEHVVVNYPYLIIEKFIMPHTLATASPGDTVAYSIRIINPNSGKADALIWSIIDELQYGHSITSNGTGTLTYANGTNSSYNFTFNSTTGSVNFIPTDWTGNFSIKLSPGGELILNFTTYVDSSAELYGCDKASYNATDLMNTSITQTYAEKCLSILKPQVRITKVSNTTTAEPGSMVEFTLILENRGSSAVYNVTVNDVMSAGWEFIAATQNITGMNDTESNSPGSSSNNTVLFGNITLNAGDKKTIKYAALVTDNASGGLNVNCANITGYGGSNANYTDGYCINVMVYLPALEIVKDVSQHDVEPGSEPLVTIIIENPTYATVYNVTITDFLPRGFNYTAGSAKLNGRTIDDPVISGNQSDFACDWSACDAPGAGTGNGLNVTWRWNETNFTDAAGGLALDNIPAKTIMVLTFKSHVKCSVCNDTFNNTVNVSGVTGAGGAVGPESTFFEMKGYLADAEIYKYASNNAPTYFEYVDYKIVIWNNPVGANIAPLTLADIMPPYLRYVPGYAYVGDLKLEPAVCGDYTDKTTNDTITNVRNDSSGVNCTGFNGTLMDAAGTKFNATESQGDGKGQILLWNLSKWLFLTPGQQVTVKYRTTIIPGIAGTARNNVTLSYLDPEHPDLCLDCEFDMSTSAVIAVNSPPGFVPDDVNYTLNLNRGWNLISVPIRPYDTSLSSVLAPVEGRYLDVASWDSQWVYRSYAYGDWFGSLSTIEPGKGYWLNMREPASLTVSGETITEFNLTLHGGWNLIGWPSLEPVPLNNLSVDYVDAATWDSQWIYRSYAYGDWFGSLSSLEPGKGYWLNVKENAVIQNIPQESGSGGS